jgi:hypothetical protein
MLTSKIQARDGAGLTGATGVALGGTAMVQRASIRDSQRRPPQAFQQCAALPRARSPPVRAFCDLTKRSLHDAHTRPHGR